MKEKEAAAYVVPGQMISSVRLKEHRSGRDLHKVMPAGTNAQKKDLLHRVVKKVLIKDRCTVEARCA